MKYELTPDAIGCLSLTIGELDYVLKYMDNMSGVEIRENLTMIRARLSGVLSGAVLTCEEATP